MPQRIKAGDIATYTEDGASYEVMVIENNSNDIRKAYKLRILKIIDESPIWAEEPKVGSTFECSHNEGVPGYHGQWTLERIPD